MILDQGFGMRRRRDERRTAAARVLASAVSLALLSAGLLASAPALAGWRGPSLAFECKAPPGSRIDLESLPIYRRAAVFRPSPPPPPQLETSSIAACREAIKKTAYCRMGDIVVIGVGSSLLEVGACQKHPKGAHAYYLYDLSTYVKHIQSQSEIEDLYQTYIFFSSFYQADSYTPVGKLQSCGTLAWHSELYYGGKQIMNIDGIGMSYNPAPAGQELHAVMNMWSLRDWTEDEFVDTKDVTPLNILAHENEHDVCCSIKYYDEVAKKNSSALIGQQGAHWSFYYNTYGQLMYGTDWREEGNGTFFAAPPARGERPLDLYLWGLVPTSAVPTGFIVDTKSATCSPSSQTLSALAKDCPGKSLSSFDLCLDPPYYRGIDGSCGAYTATEVQNAEYVTAKGQKRTVTIDDIVQANGERYPDYKSSPKVNTQLFVLLTNEDNPVTQADIDTLDELRRNYSRHLYTLTSYKLRNRNTVDATDDSGLWEWGGAKEWDGDTELEGWQGVSLASGKPLAVTGKGEVELVLTGAGSGMTNSGVRVKGSLYDAIEVVLTVPAPASGSRLLTGKLLLKGAKGTKEVRFPVYADGSKKKVVVHVPQKLLAEDACSGCVAECQGAGTADEGWFSSCTGELIKGGTCKSSKGTACGPYCSSPEHDVVLDTDAVEGWYDTCSTTLDDTFTSLTLLPVASDDAAELGGPVRVDRLQFLRVSELDLDESKLKDGEKDGDGDGIVNAFDNCKALANPDQIDSNSDGEGDACGDYDADGVPNALDNCPAVVNSLQQDSDGDGVGDACDPKVQSGCSTAGGAPRPGVELAIVLVLLGLRARGRARRRGALPPR
jgi:hypothetical protein